MDRTDTGCDGLQFGSLLARRRAWISVKPTTCAALPLTRAPDAPWNALGGPPPPGHMTV